MKRSNSTLAAIALALLAFAPALRAQNCGNFIVVDISASATCYDFTEIWQATQAAPDGATILVLPGTYQPFSIANRGLTVLANAAGTVRVAGTIRVVGLAPTQFAAIEGIFATGGVANNPGASAGLFLSQNIGSVYVQHSTVYGGSTDGNQPPICSDGRPGISIDQSSSVTVTNAVISGGSPAGTDCALGNGGDGIVAMHPGTQVALWQCTVSGGAGSTNALQDGSDAGAGGASYRSLGIQTFFAQLCELRGGEGGSNHSSVGRPGAGGIGFLEQGVTPFNQLIGTRLFGGLGGVQAFGEALDFAPESAFIVLPAATSGPTVLKVRGRRVLAPQRVFSAGEATARLIFSGDPGDQVFLDIGPKPAFDVQIEQASGIAHVAGADPSASPSIGTIDAAGTPLAYDLPLPVIGPAERPVHLFVQPRFVAPGARPVLGNPVLLVALPLLAK